MVTENGIPVALLQFTEQGSLYDREVRADDLQGMEGSKSLNTGHQQVEDTLCQLTTELPHSLRVQGEIWYHSQLHCQEPLLQNWVLEHQPEHNK